MTKSYFNPAYARFINPVTGKEFRSSRRLNFRHQAFKVTPSEEEDEEEKTALLKEVEKRAAKQITERGWTPELQKSMSEFLNLWKEFPLDAVRSLADKDKGALSQIDKLEKAFEKMEISSKESTDGKRLSIRGQIAAWQKTAGIDNNPESENFGKWRKEKKPLPELVLDMRAATVPMTPANTLNSSAYLPVIDFDYTLNDIPRFKLTFWDYLIKGRTNSAAYGWVNKTNPQGAAGFIAPGVTKPYISFEVETQISTPVKVAALDKVAQELLDDIDSMESWIKDELRYQVLLEVNTKLMTNAVTANEPTGIQNLSVAFTQTGLSTTNPTYADALRAVVAQMRAGKLQGDITIFINPIDSANMDMQKATTSGVYMFPPFMTANGKNIAGATIVEDNNIAVGSFQAAFLIYYVVKIYKPLVIDFGYVNDDFAKNLLTYRAEMRLHQIFNDQYTGAFVYDTFANVLAAIG